MFSFAHLAACRVDILDSLHTPGVWGNTDLSSSRALFSWCILCLSREFIFSRSNSVFATKEFEREYDPLFESDRETKTSL